MNKRFDEWNEIKKTAEHNEKIANFRQKEIFVTNIGENVGFEQNGKGEQFLRHYRVKYDYLMRKDCIIV